MLVLLSKRLIYIYIYIYIHVYEYTQGLFSVGPLGCIAEVHDRMIGKRKRPSTTGPSTRTRRCNVSMKNQLTLIIFTECASRDVLLVGH